MPVINKHHHGGKVPAGAVNIMRGTPYGNPFTLEEYTREDAVALYRQLLWASIRFDKGRAEQIRALHGKTLCCCCAPLACHGDVLLKAAAWLNDHASE